MAGFIGYRIQAQATAAATLFREWEIKTDIGLSRVSIYFEVHCEIFVLRDGKIIELFLAAPVLLNFYFLWR